MLTEYLVNEKYLSKYLTGVIIFLYYVLFTHGKMNTWAWAHSLGTEIDAFPYLSVTALPP